MCILTGSCCGPRCSQMQVVAHWPATGELTHAAAAILICFKVEGAVPYAWKPYVPWGYAPVVNNRLASPSTLTRDRIFSERCRALDRRSRRKSEYLRTPAVLTTPRSFAALTGVIKMPRSVSRFLIVAPTSGAGQKSLRLQKDVSFSFLPLRAVRGLVVPPVEAVPP